MIHLRQPQSFHPKFDVVSCFIEVDNQLLILLRQDHKSEGNKWGVPAGKIDPCEPPKQAIMREIREETGIQLRPGQINRQMQVYVKYPDYDFVYYMFQAILKDKPAVKIAAKEHKDYRWATIKDILEMDLVLDEDACIKLFYQL